MKKIPLSTLFLVCLVIGCSQNEDNLTLKIQKITSLQKKAKFPVNSLSFDYLKEAEEIINSENRIPDTVKIENIFSKGYCYKNLGQLDSATFYLHKAINFIDSSNTRKRDITYYRNSWEVDLLQEKYGDVVTTANKFIKSVATQNYDDLMFAYNALERINLYLRNYEKALLYNDSVQKVATSIKNREMSLITSSARANTFYQFGRKDDAIHLMDSLIANIDVNDYNDANRQFYRSYGILRFYTSDFTEAILNYKKSLFQLKKIKEVENLEKEMFESYLNISEAYIELKEYDLAKKYKDSAKNYINTNTTFDNLSFYGEVSLKLEYLNTKKIDNILSGYYTLVNNQNKIHEQKIEKELLALKIANEKEQLLLVENKQKEISNLRLKSSLLIFLLLLTLLTVIGFLFYRQKKLRFQRNDLLLQQRLLRSQMNPHFTFNALSTIQNLITDDQKTASDYLLRFSRLLRLILENSIHNFVDLELELELLEKYMELQLLRFPKKFTYTISLVNIDKDDLLFIPPMLLQPFIENSIEHGFGGINYVGHIDIKLIKKVDYIQCKITDNGLGFSKPSSQKKLSSSTQLISDFILKTTKTTIKTTNRNDVNTNETGVCIDFLIPYNLTEND